MHFSLCTSGHRVVVALLRVLGVVAIQFCCGGYLIAQQSYMFHHLTSQDGLSNSNVGAIIKDSYGFLWIGTESGLNRYDGYDFKNYHTQIGEPNAMASNNIWGLQEDALGNIWINSFVQSVYDRRNDNFIMDLYGYLSSFGISVEGEIKVYIDKDKNLWVFGSQKVYYYSFESQSLKTYTSNINTQSLEVNYIIDDGTNLQGLSPPGILWRMEKATGKITSIDLESEGIKQPELYRKLYFDSQGTIWMFSWSSSILYYRAAMDSSWVSIGINPHDNDSANRILDLIEDSHGRIWIGTDHDGLYIYDRDEETIVNISNDPNSTLSIASNNVRHLYRDSNDVIWIGHRKKGVSYYHGSFLTITNFTNKDYRDVSMMLEDSKGQLWLGTDGNGLYVKENAYTDNVKKIPIGNIPIVSLIEDMQGRIWIGTYLNGLYCYDNGLITQFTKANSKLLTNNVWDLVIDRYGNLWVGTLAGGLQCFRVERRDIMELETLTSGMEYILDLYYPGGDQLYIGTVFGLHILDITTGKHNAYFGNKSGTESFKQVSISNIFSKDSIVWLGHSGGLTAWDLEDDTLYFLDKSSGLTDNITHGITIDEYNDVWVTTCNGLSVLSTEQAESGQMSISIHNYSTKDGFIDNYFNDHSLLKLNNGDILLGGTEGYSVVNPGKIAGKNRQPARVLLTGLSVGGQPIRVDSTYLGRKLLIKPIEETEVLRLKYDDKLIEFTFTTGDLLYADKVMYAYKLDGFNNRWIHSSNNKIEFSSLPPGSYHLQIKARNSDGVWNDEATGVDIEVAPPFYLSRWALITYASIMIVLTVYLRHQSRKRHAAKLMEHKEQLIRDQKAKLNDMKLRFFTNISHDLRTPLTLITTPLQALLHGDLEQGIRKRLLVMNKNAEQLLQLINSLLDFRKLDVGAEVLHLSSGDFVSFLKEICSSFEAYAAERQVGFSFYSEMDNLSMQFDSDKVQKMMLNLLSNAFKFTADHGRVEVHVYKEKEYICVNISDNGRGINDTDREHIFEQFFQASNALEKTGSGIGLHIVNEYVRLHSGLIMVTNNYPHGSIFTFKLPIIEVGVSEKSSIDELDDFEGDGEQVRLSRKPTLLMVDDNKDFCEFISDSLNADYQVVTANNGIEALRQLEKHDINVVVSDIMMPEMNGTELCHQIKTNIHWSHIPVILLTAKTSEEYKMEGLEMGADDYITKPFNLNHLRLRLQKLLEWTEKSHLSFGQKMDISPSDITITPLDEQLIDKAIKIVETHISDSEFSVEHLGSELGLSRSHLYKKLMNITGRGPSEFIRTLRLKRSRQLLEQSQLQISEIAYSVGFNSPKRYAINFKSEFGMSPSEYLKRTKNPTDQEP